MVGLSIFACLQAWKKFSQCNQIVCFLSFFVEFSPIELWKQWYLLVYFRCFFILLAGYLSHYSCFVTVQSQGWAVPASSSISSKLAILPTSNISSRWKIDPGWTWIWLWNWWRGCAEICITALQWQHETLAWIWYTGLQEVLEEVSCPRRSIYGRVQRKSVMQLDPKSEQLRKSVTQLDLKSEQLE